MFRYICIIVREFQSCTTLKLRSFYFIKNYQIKILIWLLLIKCSLYDFYNIICISSMFTLPYICSVHIPVLMLPVCWGGEYWTVKYSFIHLVVCRMTGPKPLPKRALHIVRSRASSFKWQYPLLSLRSSNSFLCLLPCLPVTSIPPCIFPSVTHCRRQFLRKMWPIQFAFRLRISCRIFLCSLTLSNTSSFLTWSVQLIFSILLQHHISKLSRCFWSPAQSV